MLFSSITFLYCFLPCVLLVYFVVPDRMKNLVLLLASLFFYGWGEPKYLVFMLASVTQSYIAALLVERFRGTRIAKLALAVSAVASLGLLAYCKYADFFIGNFNAVTGFSIPLLKVALPVGISFYTFQILSYVIDVYRGGVPAQRNFVDLAMYVAMFPQLIAGPIVRYSDIAGSLKNRKTTLAQPLIDYIGKSDDDCFVSPLTGERLTVKKTLLIVVDTHKADFVDSKNVYEKAQNVIVIDHHRKTVDYINNAVIFYHEPHASSTCEMVTELLQYISKHPVADSVCATALMSGIMLDTKEFVLRAGVRTFEAAAYLRSRGADTVTVKSFFANSMESRKLRGMVVMNAQMYRACAISVTDIESDDIRVVCAQAADELLSVSGVDASFVIFKTDDIINISARSMGKVNVQLIMEALGGGGHQTMAAVQLKDITESQIKDMLKTAIDNYYSNL